MSTPPSRPRPSPTPASKKSGGVASLVTKTAWLVAVAAGVWFVLNMQKTSQGPPTADAQAPPRASAATVAPENLQNVELTTAASIQRQQLSTAKFRQRQVIATYDEATRALKVWETEADAWEKTGPPLVKSEDGKRLARDQSLVKRYRVVMNQEVPIRESLRLQAGLQTTSSRRCGRPSLIRKTHRFHPTTQRRISGSFGRGRGKQEMT